MITVVGSMNIDIVLNVQKIPRLGETVPAFSLEKHAGGKGANQAVAAARLGSKVFMIGSIGNDENGTYLMSCLKKNGVNTDYLSKVDLPTGSAFIMVDEEGNNSIVVYPGANEAVTTESVRKCVSLISVSDVVISQFEIPIDTVFEVFHIAKQYGKITILNPAPVKKFDERIFAYTDIVVLNETESESITGVYPSNLEDMNKISEYFYKEGVKGTIITLGKNGAYLNFERKYSMHPGFLVQVVDTTAAGDSFIGALAYKISIARELSFDNLFDAVNFANKVGALAVTKKGAQDSIPYYNEVISYFGGE